ncbi:MAG TPA: ATP-binding protein [Kofleriaceae bacterium]
MTIEAGRIKVRLGSTEKSGAWEVPRELDINVKLGNASVDMREAVLQPGTTTFTVDVSMGNLEIIVPHDLPVIVDVDSTLGNVEASPNVANASNAVGSTVRVVGSVRLGNCEVITLERGKSLEAHFRDDLQRDKELRHQAREERHEARSRRNKERHHRHERRRRRWQEIQAEKDLWQRDKHRGGVPWWLMSRMRRRIFMWLAIAVVVGFSVGYRLDGKPHWWWIPITLGVLGMVSGGIAWKLTHPMILAIKAARDIGDGKLDSRIDVTRYGGEVHILGTALNEMAEKIQKQLSDQRQLLAAVSHELRTPLGHMRVLIETARDAKDEKALGELEKEVLVLDDLVGRLLAQSRLEFGSLDRKPLDLGELAADVVIAASLPPEIVEADGDVKASVDPTLMRRAIANLVENARVHGNGAVAVRVQRRGAQIAIEVDDAGPGVAADRRADAFRAFVPSSGGGLGLGLALVSRIAVAHGGGAWISDRPGGGARVGFTVNARA